MDNSNDKTRKRDIFKHGFDKAASKFGLSSQSQAGPSHMYNAMASTGGSLFHPLCMLSAHCLSVTNSMSVMPNVSQAHKNAYYPNPPVWPHVDNPDESVRSSSYITVIALLGLANSRLSLFDRVHWKAPPDSRTSGQKLAVNFNRLGGDDEEKKKKKKTKVEDNKTGPKDDNKKKKSNS